MAESALIINLQGITAGYPPAPPLLHELCFALHQGEKIRLVGYNGSGKTTFLQLLVGLVKPLAGRLEIFGRPLAGERDFHQVRRQVGFLFQDADNQLFSPTVLEDVAFGPLNHGQSPAAARETALRTLADLGLTGMEDRLTHQLSGGTKRLVALAAVLALAPSVLLFDEPTTGLDEETRKRLTGVVGRPELSAIVVSHDYDFLAAVTDRIYCLENGRIVLEEEAAGHSHYHVHRFGRYPHQHE